MSVPSQMKKKKFSKELLIGLLHIVCPAPCALCSHPQVPVDTARVRMLGTSNRLIGGLLLFNQRGLPAACANSRFSGISGTCKNGEIASWLMFDGN